MTTTVTAKPMHALIGLTHVTDGVLGPILDSSLKGLLASANIYSKAPLDLAAYGNLINEYKASIPAALDGSRTAVAQKDKLRSAVIKMYKQLAHYVEAACNEDMATFMLSGFQPKPLSAPSLHFFLFSFQFPAILMWHFHSSGGAISQANGGFFQL